MEKISKEKLEELMELVLNYSPKPPSIIVPNRLLEQEIAEHPERFSVSNDGDKTITWCGYIVYSYGDRYENN